VLTHGSRTTGSEDVGNQRSTPLSTLGADVPWHEETPSAPARRKRVAPKTKRRNRKKGGWRTRKGLTWAQVKEVYEFAKLARQAGFPLNAFVTIKASWRCSSDQDRKRDISRKIAHLGQALAVVERLARTILSAPRRTRKNATAFSTPTFSFMSRISLSPSNGWMAISSK
jgi:hypothetical protein